MSQKKKKITDQCVDAFVYGNKQDAERLLPRLEQPAAIRTTGLHKQYNMQYTEKISLLHLAAHHGWMDIIIDLITKYKCDTNCKDSHGHTPLHYAACKNQLLVVRYFINEERCNLMTRDKADSTLLHLACNNRSTHIVQYLLSTGKLDPLAKNKYGKRANVTRNDIYGSLQFSRGKWRHGLLHLAAHNGWIDVVIDLITKYKCDTNCKDSHGITPLQYAVINNHLELVKYFINEQHCDPMTRDNDGDTPLHIACDYSHIDIVRYLLSTGKVDPLAKNNNGAIAMFKQDKIRLPMLHLAAHHGWMDVIISLMTRYKCDTNCKDSHGRTPQHYAASNNHLEVLKYFINEQHCNSMTRDNDGNTPLHLACNYSHINIVQCLLSTGKVDPLAKNNDDVIAVFEQDKIRLPMLHLAAHLGWMDVIISLKTRYKCDTNCKDSHGRTPLHYAVINNHLEVVRYFINEQHCDPMTRDNDDDTLLHIACNYSHTHMVQYLLSTGKLDPLAKNKYGKRANVTPNDIYGSLQFSQGEWRHSLLHLAAHNGWMNVVIDLIPKYKCDTNCKDSDGRTPLHYAVINNHLEVVWYFINEQHCDPMTGDNVGNTPLHYACRYGHLNIAQYLIREAHCNPSCENNDGDTPLHYACEYHHTDIVQYLLTLHKVKSLARNKNGDIPILKKDHIYGSLAQYSLGEWKQNLLHLAAYHGWVYIIIDLIIKYKCDTNCKDEDGCTPLHYAASNNHLEVVRYFINEQHCDPMTRDNDGCTPLHYAVINNHLEVVRYFINEQHCDPMTRDNDGNTPLHIACECSSIPIVQFLLSTGEVDPLTVNNNGENPVIKIDKFRLPMLHLAAHHGWMDIIIDLIAKCKCDTNCKDSHGHTPLQYAVINNHLEVVRYFINEQRCDPMTRDNDGDTLAHLACQYGNVHMLQYLLSTGKVDPLAKNNQGKTPVDIASRQYNSYDLLKQFQSFPECKREFPVHTYTKLILTGYSGTGKTTISQLILLLAKETGFFSWLSSGRVTNVECLTAGIIPLHVESKANELGNMVIYDFAGQQEYYSSHAAVLERIMRNSAAIFVCIVDLSQCMDKISESIHYWMSFIENACSSAQGSSHVIIVGSHADLVNSSQELKEKSSLVESIAESRVKQLTYGGFASMDCRESKTKQARHFCSLLSTSQQAILSSQPSMSLYCHVLYAFLRTKLKKVGCTLQELTTALASEENFSLDSTVYTETLTSLSDKGLILFVQNQEHPQSSWVVVEKKALLREVNGTLFAPNHFKQYRQVASNTGIVPIVTLEELFPQYSSEMLVGCLESMEFCHPVDISTLQATNLKANSSSPPSGANHLFFPSLVKADRPEDLPSTPRFGWCLGCSDPHQFFSNRFLHVLLLRLAFMFPLASINRSLSPILHSLERQCKVWRNGICWKSVSGVSTIVEIVDLNRWVIVLVSEKTREAAQTCSSVIRMILDLQHQLCSAVTTCECLISPSLLDGYPFDALPDTDLFDLPTVARSMLLHHKLLLDRKEGNNEFLTEEALSCEPYYLLQPSFVCQLFNQSMATQPVPDPLLQEVLSYCQLLHQKPRDHKELRECVNKHSIFAGRNPLVSCSVQAVL